MPQLQAISLNDRETTPVAHAFVPRDIKNGVGTVVRSTGIPVGDESLTVSMRRASTRYRGKVTLSVPVVQTQTINGVSTPVVVRTAYADVNFTFDATSTTQERKNLVGMMADALAAGKVLVNGAIVDLEGVY
jgi:hypothetical protein